MIPILDLLKSLFKGTEGSICIADRRRYPRVPSTDLIKISDPVGGHENIVTNLIDISEGGFQFLARDWVSTPDAYKFEVNLAHENRKFRAIGKVVWTKQYGFLKKYYRAGVSFLQIAEEDVQTIRQYVCQTLELTPS